MVKKLIDNIDESVWRKLSGYSKINNMTIGEYLCSILEDYFNDKKM